MFACCFLVRLRCTDRSLFSNVHLGNCCICFCLCCAQSFFRAIRFSSGNLKCPVCFFSMSSCSCTLGFQCSPLLLRPFQFLLCGLKFLLGNTNGKPLALHTIYC